MPARKRKYNAGSGVKPRFDSKRGIRQDDPLSDHQERSDRQRKAGATTQWVTRSTDDKQHQCLRCQRLHKPARMEQRFRGMEDPQQDEKSQKIEDRTDRANEHHEVANEADVPALRLLDETRINIIIGNGHLRQVVEEVVEQDLHRQHGQKGQEDEGSRHAEYIAEI